MSVTHGGRRGLNTPAAFDAVAAKRAELAAHLGNDLSPIQMDLVLDYCRLDVLIETVSANIAAAGIFSAKGSTRAATRMFLVLTDRRLRLAQTLGIERRAPRPVHPLDAVQRAVEEANR